MGKIRDKIEGLRDRGKGMRGEGRNIVRASRQKPGERLTERKGPIRRFLTERDRPLLNQLKNDGPLRGLLKKDE